MAKKKTVKRVKRALVLHKLAVELGPNHPWEQPMLDKAAASMVALHLHRKKTSPPLQSFLTGSGEAAKASRQRGNQ